MINGVILAFVEEPLPARVRKRGDTLKINWIVPAAYDSRQQKIPQFGYSATFDTVTRAVSVLAKPVGFPQSWRGSGNCTPRKNMSPRELSKLLRG